MDTSDNCTTKACRKCGKEYPATPNYFHRDRGLKGGLTHACKECRGGTFTPIKGIIKNHRRCTGCGIEYPATTEFFHRSNQSCDGLRMPCKQCRRESAHQRYLEDTEKIRQSATRWRKKNQNRASENRRRWEARNQDKHRQQHRIRSHNRRARILKAGGHFTPADLEAQYKSQKGLCWWCGKPLNGIYHPDHLIPLARSGTNWPNNIVCACPTCNQSKSDKLPHEWNGRLF